MIINKFKPILTGEELINVFTYYILSYCIKLYSIMYNTYLNKIVFKYLPSLNKFFICNINRSEERQYCWNCNSRISPRCGRRLSRHLARSVSVPSTRTIHQSVPCIRSKSMPYHEKDISKMHTSKFVINYFISIY